MKKTIIILFFALLMVLVACGDDLTTFRITFDPDNGTAINDQEIKSGSLVKKPTDPVKAGYDFKYWYSDDETVEFHFNIAPTSDLNLKAYYEVNEAAFNELRFNEGMAFLDVNNYELTIDIRDHATLSNTIFNLYFAGNLSYYEDASYHAYYEHTNSGNYIYENKLGEYVKSELDEVRNQFYYDFKYSWFSVVNDKYILKQDSYSKIRTFLNLDSRTTTMENLYLEFDDNHLSLISFDLKIDGETTYLVKLTFYNFNEIVITLPEVGV